jgi:GT2 family glycosyltransferase
VVCHDADIPVPACYAAALFQRFREGWEAVQIQRFLFYLSESDTRRFLQSGRVLDGFVPVNVRQGWRGGTIAFTKAAFERIGGFDEAFIGWGGEDDEIYDRCRALRYYGFGFLPFIHLWHPPQPTKRPGAWDRNRALLRKRLAVSPEKRMEERRREAARRRDDEC